MSDHAEAAGPAVSGHAPDADGRAKQRAADRRRAAKLRKQREQAGQVRIQAWVPRERAAYARQVLHAAASGANTLPPDPAQQAALDVARAEATAAHAELAGARNAGRQVEQAKAAEAAAARELATARAEAEAARGRERAAQDAAAVLRTELEGIRGRRGWRGLLLRLASGRIKVCAPSPDAG